MATTVPQVAAARPQRAACRRQSPRRQAAALRELAEAKPYGFIQARL